MKAFKVIFISVLTLAIAAYLGFLFVLPYCIDLNKYSPQITKIIQDNSDIQVELSGLKVKTGWDFSAGAFVDKTDLKYKNGEKFAQINDLEVDLSLLSLLFDNIKIDRIKADKILANLEVEKIQDFAKMKNKNSNFHFSSDMPKISIKKYRISLLDKRKNYTLKGQNLKISDFVLNKQIKIKTDGNVILNNRGQISYNLSIFAKNLKKKKVQYVDIVKIFDDLYKYNLNANINADLKINEDTNIDGKINIDKIFFTFAGKTYPQSNLKLNFKGDKARINSSFHVDNVSKALITGFFKTGKDKYVDLQVVSDKINIHDILVIVKAMSKPFGLKNLQDIDAQGFLKANFSVKSDFKKIKSNGYLKIKDASVTDKPKKVSLKSLNADIDFSQDAVNIRQANAKLNSQPIAIKGSIDKNANANVVILGENLQLNGVLFAAGQGKILKDNDISSGIVNLKAILKGRLYKAVPKIQVNLANVALKNKPSNSKIYVKNIAVNSEQNKGRAEITALKILPEVSAVISAPKISFDFDKKDLNIKKTYLYVNNIRTDLSGKVSDINSTPHLNINILIPNQISVPIEGYPSSKLVLKGGLKFSGDSYNPQVKGQFDVPIIRIPSQLTVLKNLTVQLDKDIKINCPYMQTADSEMSFNAQLMAKNNSIVVQNANFNSENINLNTVIPLFNNLSQSSGADISILNGRNSIKSFKVAGLTSTNVTSNIHLKNNILYLNNLSADAYLGKVRGSVNYDINHRKTSINLRGRGLSSNSALTALMGRNDDINGILDFDSDVSIVGFSKKELLKSLKGSTKFIVSNGKMGMLGKFEHLIYAQNVISNNVFKTSLNVIAKGISIKNTGVYKYMRGKITFANGWANILSIKTSGPSMSLYITGRYYLPDNTANLIMLGRISDDVVRILGPIGEFSMNKVISSIPKVGEITASFANQYTVNPYYENTSEIPPLTPQTQFKTREFKVVIDGDVQRQSSVKSFKWISTPKVVESQSQQAIPAKKPTPQVPDFVKNLPDLKN